MTSSDQKTQPGWPAESTTETPVIPARKPRPGMLAIGAVAVVAFLLALIAAVNSWRAASAVGALQTKVDRLGTAAAPQPGPVATPPAEATTDSPSPDATPTGSAPTLNAQTQYKVNYVSKRMNISGVCNQTVYLDLDEPRVQSGSNEAELNIGNCNGGPPNFTLADGVQGSQVDSDSVTPIECNNQIQLSPLPRVGMPLRQGQVYCVVTSLDNARAAALSWKMVVLSVSSIGEDGKVSLDASAWDIPY